VAPVLPDPDERPPTRSERFFTPLLERDPSGRTWLPALLTAAPHGRERLGELAEVPGFLGVSLAVRAASRRMACFEQWAAPPRALLEWYVEHAEALTWPSVEPIGDQASAQARRLRRALVCDDPPGARARAQSRARELAGERSALSQEWWRFEEIAGLDCVLSTDRLVLVVAAYDAGEVPGPVTPWYPERSEIVRALEAARDLMGEQQSAFATIVLSEAPLAQARDEAVASALPAGAPHLDAAAREALHHAYLGNLTWAQAEAAVTPAPDGGR
jgi:hypothetical protein